MTTLADDTSTPCIGICSTIYGDEVCRGCKRSYQEIIDWNGYPDTQKRDVLMRLDRQIESVLAEYVSIQDLNLLKAKLEKHKIVCRQGSSPLIWVYFLLLEGGGKISDLEKYGVRVHEAFKHLSPKALFDACDERIYEYAVQHYESSN